MDNLIQYRMKTIEEAKQIQQQCRSLKLQGKSIGFVPTMGALHDGHISLIKQARAHNDIVIVSIFINPTQFLEGEDLEKYPKKLQADSKICELCGVDYLFTPNTQMMYAHEDEVLIKAPSIKGFILEGYKRPGHFDGMLQIVLKLFNLTTPTRAYFGKKDAQQLALIEQMVANFFLDIQIVACDLIRESSGLALSSRNIYLDSAQKQRALLLSKSLTQAANMVAKNIVDVAVIEKEMLKTLHTLELEYIAFVDRNFWPIQKIKLKNSIILVAATVDGVRLIDNIWI